MIAQRVSDFFGTDDDYVRARPERPWRTDWVIALVLSVISMSVVIFGIAFPAVVSTASMQILYFLGIYTAMAYARRRHTLMLSIIAVLFAMVVWLVVADSYARSVQPDDFKPTLWFYVGTAVMNLGFFGGAIWLGRQAWLQAKVNHELAESQRIVREQGERLAAQAVVAERLRIARDLHDSVAHHISLIGVQTGAARRAMATKPDVAAQAMQEVETMSRDAVAELRGMPSHTRREPGSATSASASGSPRSAEPPRSARAPRGATGSASPSHGRPENDPRRPRRRPVPCAEGIFADAEHRGRHRTRR